MKIYFIKFGGTKVNCAGIKKHFCGQARAVSRNVKNKALSVVSLVLHGFLHSLAEMFLIPVRERTRMNKRRRAVDISVKSPGPHYILLS